jgi:hypothetical protein
MPEVTYEYDSWSSNPGPYAWVNPNYAVDGQQGDEATIEVPLNTSTGKLTLDSNDCPGTNLGTITKVEIGLWWDKWDFQMRMYIEPAGGSTVGPYFSAGGASIEWEDATAAHATAWTWANIDTTDVDVWGILPFDGLGPGPFYLDQVYIRVTYDEVFGPANIAKVLGVVAGNIGKVDNITYTDIAKILGVP